MMGERNAGRCWNCLKRRPQVKSSPVKGLPDGPMRAAPSGKPDQRSRVRLFGLSSHAPAARVSDAEMLVRYLIADTVSIFTPAPATNESAEVNLWRATGVRYVATMVTVRP
ncbi:hypothetical protein KCP73_05305 [Salmonella enterica subsp. enterica]|nr:hypothetical protein KCP73_05305 [Salmonella enterica subsp. enterica]